jgi:hypothetical protein
MPASDVRVYDGSQWISIKGPKGDTGSTGAAGTVTLGTVTTGAPGSSVIITDSNPSPNDATLNFTIPRGDAGQAATVSVGTTNTGAAGTQAQVTNAGTASAAVFNFVIPQGAKGDPGSGVTIKGTLSGAGTALPASPATGDMYILGNPVPTAAPNGAGGTKAEGDGIVWNGTAWSNVGPIRGPEGPQGNPGTAATIAVGTVTGLAAGATPTITNTGTSTAAVFAFGIPAGAKGDPGNNFQVFDTASTPTGALKGALWLVP